MKRYLPALAAALLATGVPAARGQAQAHDKAKKPYAASRVAETGSLMAEAARRFLGSLDDDQRKKATFAFDDPERLNWHWIPRPRNGLPVKDLASDQRAMAFALLNTGLSNQGMVTAATTMSYEEIIRAVENDDGRVRNPELYFISVFGTPSDTGSWGWRWEGHHLALNFTLRDGKVVSATPFMFGSNPATVPSGPRKGLRNLAAIQDPIYALVASLDQDQLKAAVISTSDVPDVTTGPNAPRPPAPEALGISSDKLTAEQKDMLRDALAAYVFSFPESIAMEMGRELEQGGHQYYFAWYGSTDPSKEHAFRIQGPAVLIDFNDKQNDANHIHTFYRSMNSDFGLSGSK